MVDTVTNTTIFAGTRRHIIHLTNVSDGTGESAVVKVDVSALTGPDGTPPTAVTIEEISWDIQGFTSVTLAWDATTDDTIAVLSGQGYSDWTAVGGLHDPASTGATGDVVLTTTGAAANASYDITIVCKLED